MKKCVCTAIVFLVMVTALGAVSKHDSMYVGGTTDISKEVVGVINTDDKTALNFHWDGNLGFGDWSLPYAKITSLSYREQVGRGVGSSIALGVTTLGVGTVPMLLSKKRRHFLTIEFLDDKGSPQSAIFEVGKDAVGTLLPSLERRTGKKILHEDAGGERKTASR